MNDLSTGYSIHDECQNRTYERYSTTKIANNNRIKKNSANPRTHLTEPMKLFNDKPPSPLTPITTTTTTTGMDPSWRHIIPPLQQKVISEGHCTDDCTKKSFPPQGISIFAVIMQTHNIGKEVKLRQVCMQLCCSYFPTYIFYFRSCFGFSFYLFGFFVFVVVDFGAFNVFYELQFNRTLHFAFCFAHIFPPCCLTWMCDFDCVQKETPEVEEKRTRAAATTAERAHAIQLVLVLVGGNP